MTKVSVLAQASHLSIAASDHFGMSGFLVSDEDQRVSRRSGGSRRRPRGLRRHRNQMECDRGWDQEGHTVVIKCL